MPFIECTILNISQLILRAQILIYWKGIVQELSTCNYILRNECYKLFPCHAQIHKSSGEGTLA